MRKPLAVSRAKKTHEAALQKMSKNIRKIFDKNPKLDITKLGAYKRAKSDLQMGMERLAEKPRKAKSILGLKKKK